MQIVTDSGTDVYLSAEERQALNIHVVPLVVTLDGKSYREELDITRRRILPAAGSFRACLPRPSLPPGISPTFTENWQKPTQKSSPSI